MYIKKFLKLFIALIFQISINLINKDKLTKQSSLQKKMGQIFAKNQVYQKTYYDRLKQFKNTNYSVHTTLRLEFKRLSDQDVSNLALALSHCINLNDLNLSITCAKINKKSQNEILQALKNCKKIESLRIKLDQTGAKFNSDVISEEEIRKNFLKVQILLIYYTCVQFKTEATKSLGNRMTESTNILKLFMAVRPIDNEDFIYLGTQLVKYSNPKYIRLTLCEHKVDDQSHKAFACELAQIQHLLFLRIEIEYEANSKVPSKKDYIRKNKRLVQLNVCFTGQYRYL
ncbi:hypothetical protein TTHERM_000086819 (macronuclear) [Tetrahymena thermophila SB210]|uniref:Uncharacterized protein n=1 Tax=Tetrahymena thermophila (strain SB210) TaxID=312017 RepID=W7XJ54_TETTS|nr:hypothetical protein TTHERM_000086819 [Tetrahymena thermophila SB210]EWS75221.1 hypothetical protein TTHERM_000086819 [Tetrahymena thermophila SB210]|eukprot:XP_012652212.1 hypothetical protein TTHERM_000086819 [Tetrahymena thermophila SB210]